MDNFHGARPARFQCAHFQGHSARNQHESMLIFLIKIKAIAFLWLVIPALFLAGCAGDIVTLDTPEHDRIITEKQQTIRGGWADGEVIILTYAEALQNAAAANLDVRLAALEVLTASRDIDLERLSAFPEFQLSYNYSGRSSEGASSSRSVITGTESLEPSVSTDRHRDTLDLDIRWGVIDVLLAINRTHNADDRAAIAQERYRKVIHNITRDVTTAYREAYIAQARQNKTAQLLDSAEKHLTELKQAREQGILYREETAKQITPLIQQTQNLRGLHDDLVMAETELKTLLGLPQNVSLKLSAPPDSYRAQIKAYHDAEIIDLETQALENRPEMREAILSENIAQRDRRAEIIDTIPGARFIFGMNYDSNSFLRENKWNDYTLSIAQNLLRVVTLPTRLRAAEERAELEKARSHAMAAAIVTQLHLARHRLLILSEDAHQAAQAASAAKETASAQTEKYKLGFVSGQRAMLAKIEAESATIRAEMAQARLHEALITMDITLGDATPALALAKSHIRENTEGRK